MTDIILTFMWVSSNFFQGTFLHDTTVRNISKTFMILVYVYLFEKITWYVFQDECVKLCDKCWKLFQKNCFSNKRRVIALLFFLKEFFETGKLISFPLVFLNTKIKFTVWAQDVSILERELSCILEYEFEFRYNTLHISSL